MNRCGHRTKACRRIGEFHCHIRLNLYLFYVQGNILAIIVKNQSFCFLFGSFLLRCFILFLTPGHVDESIAGQFFHHSFFCQELKNSNPMPPAGQQPLHYYFVFCLYMNNKQRRRETYNTSAYHLKLLVCMVEEIAFVYSKKEKK